MGAPSLPSALPEPWQAPTPPIGHTTFLLLLLRGWSECGGSLSRGVAQPRRGACNAVSLREHPRLRQLPEGWTGPSAWRTDGRPHPGSPRELQALSPFAQCGVLFQGDCLAQSRGRAEKGCISPTCLVIKVVSSEKQPTSRRGLMVCRTHSLCWSRLLCVRSPPSSCPGCVSFPPPPRSPVTAAPPSRWTDAGVPAHQPLPLWPGSGTPPPAGSPWGRTPCSVAGPAA